MRTDQWARHRRSEGEGMGGRGDLLTVSRVRWGWANRGRGVRTTGRSGRRRGWGHRIGGGCWLVGSLVIGVCRRGSTIGVCRRGVQWSRGRRGCRGGGFLGPLPFRCRFRTLGPGLYLHAPGQYVDYELLFSWDQALIISSPWTRCVVLGDLNRNPGWVAGFPQAPPDISELFDQFVLDASLTRAEFANISPTWVGSQG